MMGGAGTGGDWAKIVVLASNRHRTGTRRFIRSQRGIQTGRYFNPIGQPMCRSAAGSVREPQSRFEKRFYSVIRARKQKRPSIEGLFRYWRPQDQAAAAINSSQVMSSVSSVAPSPSMSICSRTVLASSAIMTITAFPAPVIVSSPTNG